MAKPPPPPFTFKEFWPLFLKMLPALWGLKLWMDDRTIESLIVGVVAGAAFSGLLYGVTALTRRVFRAARARAGGDPKP